MREEELHEIQVPIQDNVLYPADFNNKVSSHHHVYLIFRYPNFFCNGGKEHNYFVSINLFNDGLLPIAVSLPLTHGLHSSRLHLESAT
jgi:hypothetical protein